MKAGRGDALENLSDEALFARSRDVAGTLVRMLGGLEPALDFVRDDGGDKLADFAAYALGCQTADEFMGYSS